MTPRERALNLWQRFINGDLMVSLLEGIEKTIFEAERDAPLWIRWPEDVPPYGKCDMLLGPCSCGVSHRPEELAMTVIAAGR